MIGPWSYVLCAPGDEDECHKGHEHGERSEREELAFSIPAGVMDESRESQKWFPSGHPHHEGHDVCSQAPVRVAMVLEVHHHEQLWE